MVSWGMRSVNETLRGALPQRAIRAVLIGQAGGLRDSPLTHSGHPHAGLVDHYRRRVPSTSGRRAGAGPVTLVDPIHSWGKGFVPRRSRAHRHRFDRRRRPPRDRGRAERRRGDRYRERDRDRRHQAPLPRPADSEAVPEGIREQVKALSHGDPLHGPSGGSTSTSRRMPATNYWLHSRYDQEAYYDPIAAGEFDTDPGLHLLGQRPDPGHEGHAPEGCSTVELMTWVTPTRSLGSRRAKMPQVQPASRPPRGERPPDRAADRPGRGSARRDPFAHPLEGSGDADDPDQVHAFHRWFPTGSNWPPTSSVRSASSTEHRSRAWSRRSLEPPRSRHRRGDERRVGIRLGRPRPEPPAEVAGGEVFGEPAIPHFGRRRLGRPRSLPQASGQGPPTPDRALPRSSASLAGGAFQSLARAALAASSPERRAPSM